MLNKHFALIIGQWQLIHDINNKSLDRNRHILAQVNPKQLWKDSFKVFLKWLMRDNTNSFRCPKPSAWLSLITFKYVLRSLLIEIKSSAINALSTVLCQNKRETFGYLMILVQLYTRWKAKLSYKCRKSIFRPINSRVLIKYNGWAITFHQIDFCIAQFSLFFIA